MSAADRAYRLLLLAYPASFRARFGREMALCFEDRRREPGARGPRFWAGLLWDVARSAPAQRLAALRGKPHAPPRTEDGTMKTMATLAILIGTFTTANAAAELWMGYGVLHARIALVGVPVAVAGALLALAGVALLRRGGTAVAQARLAATACLAAFATMELAHPALSVFARLLGFGFPVALLLALRARGPAAPTAA